MTFSYNTPNQQIHEFFLKDKHLSADGIPEVFKLSPFQKFSVSIRSKSKLLVSVDLI
jgi:hypothetical protein